MSLVHTYFPFLSPRSSTRVVGRQPPAISVVHCASLQCVVSPPPSSVRHPPYTKAHRKSLCQLFSNYENIYLQAHKYGLQSCMRASIDWVFVTRILTKRKKRETEGKFIHNCIEKFLTIFWHFISCWQNFSTAQKATNEEEEEEGKTRYDKFLFLFFLPLRQSSATLLKG